MKQVIRYSVNGTPSDKYFRDLKDEKLLEGRNNFEKKIKNSYYGYKSLKEGTK